MNSVTSPPVFSDQWYENDPIIERLRPEGIPLLYEDEGLEMGESDLHTRTCNIALYGLEFHFAKRPSRRVFSNLNLYYSAKQPNAYVSPDIMVVEPTELLPEDIASYQIGEDGPAPLLVTEVLSFRTFQEGDLSSKPVLYAQLSIPEYILVDVTGELLPRRLLLMRLQKNGRWLEEQDADGGITSQLGFRFRIDKDGHLLVEDADTGQSYTRPDEAQIAIERLEKERRKAERAARAEARARQQAEDRIRALEEELARLRGKGRKRKGS